MMACNGASVKGEEFDDFGKVRMFHIDETT